MIERLEKIANEKIRPNLARHNGDMEILGEEDGIVKIKLHGACNGCPGAKLTMEDLVETTFMEEIPEIKGVVLCDEISEEMIDFAKKLLEKR